MRSAFYRDSPSFIDLTANPRWQYGQQPAAYVIVASWAVTGSSLPCATVSLGNTCVLTLTYTPTVATPSSSLLLGYAYTDNAGQPRTGSQVITYSADSHLAFITNADSNTVTHCAVGVAGQLVYCSADTRVIKWE
jgi:hypothetical protein